MKEPLVSVILSTHNEEKYILDSINSILNQTYKNIEIIVIDDASTDATVSLIRTIDTKKIRLYVNKENKKLAHNLNFAISVAKGKYIARMDADDISRSKRLKIEVDYLEKHKDVDIVACFAKSFGDSNIIKKSPCMQEGIKATLLFTNPICHPTVMFRRSSIDFAYDESCIAGQDYELWTRIIDKKIFHVIPNILLDYRVIKRQRNSCYLQLQKENALKARRHLFEKLFSAEKDLYWEKFTMLVDVDGFDFQPKNQKKMEQIILFSNSLVEMNKIKGIFDECEFKKALSAIVFQQWYLSLLETDVTADIFMKSDYASALRQQSYLTRTKVLFKILKGKLS